MSPPLRIKIGSRASPLSLAQNEEVLSPLREIFPEVEFAIVPMSTRGDRNKEAPLLSLGRGMFVREIEGALADREIDLAIHSAKDVPSDLAEGMTLVPVGTRRDPRDVLVNRWDATLDDLPSGARLGTSSPRRTAQLRSARNDIDLKPMRGNVGTRLEKARGDDYDGAVLAAAGLIRLGREADIAQFLPPEVCTPDVGQGTLVAEVGSDNTAVLEVLNHAVDKATSIAFRAERAFLAAIGGGCKSPVAAYAQPNGGRLEVIAMAASPDGSQLYRVNQTHDLSDPEEAGKSAVEALLNAGAGELLER